MKPGDVVIGVAVGCGGNQSSPGSRDIERHIPCGAARCVGRNLDNEAAPKGCVNGLRSPGLAAGWAPRRIVLPSLRADDSSLGIDGDRPPERSRLDPGPGLRPRRLCDLKMKRRFRRMIVASALLSREEPALAPEQTLRSMLGWFGHVGSTVD